MFYLFIFKFYPLLISLNHILNHILLSSTLIVVNSLVFYCPWFFILFVFVLFLFFFLIVYFDFTLLALVAFVFCCILHCKALWDILLCNTLHKYILLLLLMLKSKISTCSVNALGSCVYGIFMMWGGGLFCPNLWTLKILTEYFYRF